MRLCAAHASLDACSKARGGRMHCAAAYEGEFPFGPREVFDLRGDQTGVGHAAVRRHLQRVASAGPGDRFVHLVGAEQGVFFGGYHVGKCTLFFGSALHAARVASAKRR